MAQTITVDDSSLERYIQTARDTGCAPDQVDRFVRAGYIAQPHQLRIHAAARECDNPGGPTHVVVGGTRNSAKTHAVFAQVLIDDCQRYPGAKWLFLRHYRKSASESFDDLAARLLRYVPHTKTTDEIRLPNGSRVLIGGYKDSSDIDKYLGLEYDGLAIEEVTQLTQGKIEMISGSVRSSRVDGYRARQYWTFNPGGIGYSWIKRQVVIPWQQGRETWSRFYYAHWRDNVFCTPEYIQYLDSLEGHLRRSWRDGDLDALEGLAYPDWDETRHVCDPFEIPSSWPRWRAVDYGYHPDPFCALWFARDLATGRVYIYREVYGTGYTDTQQARMITEMTPADERGMISATYAGRDMFATRVSAGQVSTNADEYRRQGIVLTQAQVDRIQGKRKIERALGDLQDGKPGLMVFRTCANWLRTVPLLVLRDGTEDIADGQEDHAYDATRYGLTAYEDIQPRRQDAQTGIPTRAQAALEAWFQQGQAGR